MLHYKQINMESLSLFNFQMIVSECLSVPTADVYHTALFVMKWMIVSTSLMNLHVVLVGFITSHDTSHDISDELACGFGRFLKM